MNLVIDLGNTSGKVALYEGETLLRSAQYSGDIFSKIISDFDASTYKNAILSSVIDHDPEIEALVKNCKNGILLNASINLPFINKYESPETLGQDRLANAAALATLYNGQNALCIDVGTCIKFDFVDQNKNYLGGSISPGLSMRFKSLHTFTDKLPLIELQTELIPLQFGIVGGNTKQSIVSGVANGMLAEINGMISRYQETYSDLKVILTGGDASFFENEVKKTIFADAFFTLHGLNAILNTNAV